MAIPDPSRPVVTLTMNPAVDMATHVASVLPGKKLRCAEPVWYAGGGGINVARMLRQLGRDVHAVYPYGGYLGSRLKRLLRQQGINQSPVPVRGKTRESLIISEDSSGDVYRFIMPGASLSEREKTDCLKALEHAIEQAQMLVISGSLPGNLGSNYYGEVVRLTRKHRLPILIDSSPETLPEALEEGFNLLRLNQQEFEQLIGKRDLPHEDLAREVSRFLHSHPLEALIVTSKTGALIATQSEVWEAVAPQVHKIGPSGAGDCFVAGFVHQWLLRKPLPEALRYAVASAAAAMTTPGGQLAHPEDIDQLFDKTNVHKLNMEGSLGL